MQYKELTARRLKEASCIEKCQLMRGIIKGSVKYIGQDRPFSGIKLLCSFRKLK